MEASDTILSVRNMSTEFFLQRGILRAVDRISFDLARGEVIVAQWRSRKLWERALVRLVG